MKKTTSQNLWPWINSKSFINQMRAKRGFLKTARSSVLFWGRQRNFENVALVARQRKHFRGVLAIFLVDQLPPKRGVLVHKNLLASCQRCCHSVAPRALTCPFKQSNVSAWSRSSQNYRLQVRHSPYCTLFFINCFMIEMVLCNLHLNR